MAGLALVTSTKLMLRRTRLLQRLMTTSGGYVIRNSSRPFGPTQPGHPSVDTYAMSTGDGFGNGWGRNGDFCVKVGPASKTAGILPHFMLAELGLTLAGSKLEGMSSLATDLTACSLCVYLLLHF